MDKNHPIIKKLMAVNYSVQFKLSNLLIVYRKSMTDKNDPRNACKTEKTYFVLNLYRHLMLLAWLFGYSWNKPGLWHLLVTASSLILLNCMKNDGFTTILEWVRIGISFPSNPGSISSLPGSLVGYIKAYLYQNDDEGSDQRPVEFIFDWIKTAFCFILPNK